MPEKACQTYPRCGEIWTCQLGDRGAGIQSGYRPVLILSNDRNNLFSPTVNIAPITSKMNKRSLPVHVELWDYKSFGLKVPSTILIEQTTTVSASTLDYKVGKISDDFTLSMIRKAIGIQFPIFQESNLGMKNNIDNVQV